MGPPDDKLVSPTPAPAGMRRAATEVPLPTGAYPLDGKLTTVCPVAISTIAVPHVVPPMVQTPPMFSSTLVPSRLKKAGVPGTRSCARGKLVGVLGAMPAKVYT